MSIELLRCVDWYIVSDVAKNRNTNVSKVQSTNNLLFFYCFPPPPPPPPSSPQIEGTMVRRLLFTKRCSVPPLSLQGTQRHRESGKFSINYMSNIKYICLWHSNACYDEPIWYYSFALSCGLGFPVRRQRLIYIWYIFLFLSCFSFGEIILILST
jgi:hypothetical protein